MVDIISYLEKHHLKNIPREKVSELESGALKGLEFTVQQWFSTQVILTPPTSHLQNVWQCLETFLLVTRDAIKHRAIYRTAPQNKAIFNTKCQKSRIEQFCYGQL